MTTIYSVKEGQSPEVEKYFYAFYKKNEDDDYYEGMMAFINKNNKLLTPVSAFNNDFNYWAYVDDIPYTNRSDEDFVSVTINDFTLNSDGELEDEKVGVFRHTPSEKDLSAYLDQHYNAKLIKFSGMDPKLSIFKILDETIYNVDVYSDFTMELNGNIYKGHIELYNINEWA